jgi:hypothetical protein
MPAAEKNESYVDNSAVSLFLKVEPGIQAATIAQLSTLSHDTEIALRSRAAGRDARLLSDKLLRTHQDKFDSLIAFPGLSFLSDLIIDISSVAITDSQMRNQFKYV